ncbi:hypothetical protein JVT61DRAFT_4935 [Boletus reticuloceps]|uniref:Uncharacterized protein n=1 Tax=Boletus reticuloceps TaxID=495285 RepID=A0A8I2Z1H5_9AGAM|nr:hypothetical protein JVT61DRAFT_4935 [Boletus reticuloceps]
MPMYRITGSKKTHLNISYVTHFTVPYRAVNTGIWTATFVILTLIFVRVVHRWRLISISSSLTQVPQMRVFPSTVLYVLFGIPLDSLYCNMLLANLNARAYIRGGGMMPVSDDTKAKKQNRVIFISHTSSLS